MAGIDFDVSNIGGFVKLEYNDANIVVYIGNNQTVSIRNNRYIEFNDIDQYEFHNNLCNDDTVRRNLVIDYDNLIDKRGTATPQQYVEVLITSGDLDQQVVAGGGAGTNVTIVGDTVGLAKEAKQDTGNTSLSSIDSKTPVDPATVTKQNEIITAINGISAGGDATAANQVTQITEAQTANAALSSIDSKITADPSTATLQTAGNTSLSSIDSKIPADPATVTKQNEIISAISAGSFDGSIVFPKAFTDISGALHTESATTQIDLKQTKDNLPLFFDRVNNGTATQIHSGLNAETVMSVLSGGDYAIAQTKERFNYLTGKTKRILLTFSNFDVQSGVIKRAGYFNGGVTAPYDTFDGVYIESDGTTINVCFAKNGSVTKIPRSSWNDPLNGTGPSGLNIDFDNFIILRIEFLWLGGGPIRFQIETNDELYTFHTVLNGNSISSTYISSPNQPARYEIRSTGGSGSLDQICTTVGNSGGNDLIGVERGYIGFENINLSSTANNYLVYSSRLKQTHLDVTVSILDYETLFTTNDNFVYTVLMNPTFSVAPTYTDISNSALQIASGNGSITVSGGTILRSGVGSQQQVISARQTNVLRLGSTIAGVADEIVYAVRPLTSNARAYATQNWLENN